MEFAATTARSPPSRTSGRSPTAPGSFLLSPRIELRTGLEMKPREQSARANGIRGNNGPKSAFADSRPQPHCTRVVPVVASDRATDGVGDETEGAVGTGEWNSRQQRPEVRLRGLPAAAPLHQGRSCCRLGSSYG